MEWHDVRELNSELQTLRNFFFEIAANQDQLSITGLKGIKKLKGYSEAVEILPTIESRMIQLEKLATFVDAGIAERLRRINQESPFVRQSVELKLTIQLAEIRRPSASIAGSLRRVFTAYGRLIGISGFRELFEDSGEIPIRRMLNDLERTIPFVEQLKNTFLARVYNDEEVFKPSNINVDEVNIFIDKAIVQITNNYDLDSGTRARLESYLAEAKAELAKDAPAWKKIVGALVIVSAILGGIAVVPDALTNINAAVKYILGTSIESVVPKTTFGPQRLPPAIDV